MDFESSFIHCIKTNDVKGIEALRVDEAIANEPFVSMAEVLDKESLNGVHVPKYPTPLVFAILCKKEDVVMHLIEKEKAKIDLYIQGWAPIHYAIATKQEKLVAKLVECDKSVMGCKTDRNGSALQIAVSVSSVEIVEFLLLNGADVNEQNDNGNSALHIAMTIHSPRIVKDLVAFGANTELKNKQGKTPGDIAIAKKKQTLLDALKEKPATKEQVRENYERLLRDEDERNKAPASDPGAIEARIENISHRVSVVEEKLGLQ
jgi:hypothetical protein